jgi:uncharacterized protein
MDEPTIRILQPGDEAALEAFLLPRLESSMFLLSNLRSAGIVDTGQPYAGTYAAAFDDGAIIGVAAHYWNQNLIFQAPVLVDALWRAAVTASGRPIRGLIGPGEQVWVVKTALRIDVSHIQIDETEKLYRLTLDALVEPDDLRSGKTIGRRIEPRDLDVLTEWRIAYSLEAVGDPDSPQLRDRCRASVERSLSDGLTWVLEAHGTPVACSSFNAVVAEVVQIGGVWTPPQLRGRGYGRAVVAASLKDARAEGKKRAILFTGAGNVPAQKAYAALGFEHIGDYRIVLLHTPIRGTT